jgi:hypothetical protein
MVPRPNPLNTNRMIQRTYGTKPMSAHHPETSMSCQRLTLTAMPGQMITADGNTQYNQ